MKILNIIIISSLAFLFVRCANQLPPTGGPEDKTPPEIIDVVPPNGTTNYSGNSIELTFSEYVDHRSVQDAIFISPKIDGQIEYDWSGKSVALTFADSLKERTTYVITIGTDVVDINNKNKLAFPATFAFSTGEEIYAGEIDGKVYADDPSGVMIYCYRLDSLNVNPMKTQADIVSQVGVSGGYRLLGLSDGKYRVFAIRDEYRNGVYDVGDDLFGAPFTDVAISAPDSIFSGLNFRLTREDTTKPQLVSATMTDRNHITIEFSEFIDSSKVTADNFFIIDSTDSSIIPVGAFYKGSAGKMKYFLIVKDSLNKEGELFLYSENIFDNFGNGSIKESVGFVSSDKPDTLAPKIVKTLTQYESGGIDLTDSYVNVIFSDAVNMSAALKSFELTDSKNRKIKIETRKLDDASVRINILSKVKSREEYLLKTDFNLISDFAGNRIDSVFTNKLKAVNKLDFSGVSGKVISRSQRIFVELINSGNTKIKYSSKAENNKFNFEKVLPGKYKIFAYEDSDSNSRYSYGNVFPFIKSEKFSFYPDTLNLRARWPVGDVIIDLK